MIPWHLQSSFDDLRRAVQERWRLKPLETYRLETTIPNRDRFPIASEDNVKTAVAACRAAGLRTLLVQYIPLVTIVLAPVQHSQDLRTMEAPESDQDLELSMSSSALSEAARYLHNDTVFDNTTQVGSSEPSLIGEVEVNTTTGSDADVNPIDSPRALSEDIDSADSDNQSFTSEPLPSPDSVTGDTEASPMSSISGDSVLTSAVLFPAPHTPVPLVKSESLQVTKLPVVHLSSAHRLPTHPLWWIGLAALWLAMLAGNSWQWAMQSTLPHASVSLSLTPQSVFECPLEEPVILQSFHLPEDVPPVTGYESTTHMKDAEGEIGWGVALLALGVAMTGSAVVGGLVVVQYNRHATSLIGVQKKAPLSVTDDPLPAVVNPEAPARLVLRSDSNIKSTDRTYECKMQNDGNLVVYNRRIQQSIWSSQTANQGVPPYTLEITETGNLELKESATDTPLWTSSTGNTTVPGPYMVRVLENGSLVLSGKDNGIVWTSDTTVVAEALPNNPPLAAIKLEAPSRLTSHNDNAITSPNGTFECVMQNDGNLVIYMRQTGHPVWSTKTDKQGTPPYELVVMETGNLELRESATDTPLWTSSTGNTTVPGPYTLCMRDDGNLVLSGRYNGVVWQTTDDEVDVILQTVWSL
jgi:hypothetical protein